MSNKERKNQDHFPALLEYAIIIAIILVVVHTIFEELSIMFHWSHDRMNYILIAGFVFDLIFSAEFVARSVISFRRFELKRYFLSERGWVDAVTSLPLLFLISGPALYFLIVGDQGAIGALEFLHILKTAKAVRVTRVLRLIRVLKIFGKIQNASSPMTHRHVSTVSTIGVVSLVLILVSTQFVPFLNPGDHEHYRLSRVEELSSLLKKRNGITLSTGWISGYLRNSSVGSDVIVLKDGKGKVIFENERAEDLRRTAYPGSMELVGGYSVELSYHPADAQHARLNLIMLLAILLLISSMVLVYTRIFAQNVADPIYIMDRGLREWDYNLEARIHPFHRDEEVFRLARAYNVRWLALKNRILKHRDFSSGRSRISMEDIF